MSSMGSRVQDGKNTSNNPNIFCRTCYWQWPNNSVSSAIKSCMYQNPLYAELNMNLHLRASASHTSDWSLVLSGSRQSRDRTTTTTQPWFQTQTGWTTFFPTNDLLCERIKNRCELNTGWQHCDMMTVSVRNPKAWFLSEWLIFLSTNKCYL